MNKNQLRQLGKDIRAGIRDEQRVKDDESLRNNIQSLIVTKATIRCVGTYYAIGSEIDTGLRQSDDYCLSLPVIRNDQSLEFYEWSEGEPLVKREFNIPIPDTRHKSPVMPDIIFFPLLLCDVMGNRIGYGKGHYDRYITGLGKRPLCVGVCFDEQIYEGAIPAEPHDVRLDMIITPERIVDVK